MKKQITSAVALAALMSAGALAQDSTATLILDGEVSERCWVDVLAPGESSGEAVPATNVISDIALGEITPGETRSLGTILAWCNVPSANLSISSPDGEFALEGMTGSGAISYSTSLQIGGAGTEFDDIQGAVVDGILRYINGLNITIEDFDPLSVPADTYSDIIVVNIFPSV